MHNAHFTGAESLPYLRTSGIVISLICPFHPKSVHIIARKWGGYGKKITHMIRDRVNDEAFSKHIIRIDHFIFSFFPFSGDSFPRTFMRYVFIRSDDYIYIINSGVWWCVKYLISEQIRLFLNRFPLVNCRCRYHFI